jgi:hypothetical protein
VVVSSVVAPVKRKFQPMPSSSKAARKRSSSSPVSAMATQARLSSTPATITRSVPKRWIRWPVKKAGTNMPSTCHSITSAASRNGSPQRCMASGVAAISRFITP